MPKGQTLTERFNNRYQIDNKTGCWEWTGSKDVDGYGVIWTREANTENQQQATERRRNTNLSSNRSQYYKNMSDEDFVQWEKRFIGKTGRERSNLTFARRARNEQTK